MADFMNYLSKNKILSVGIIIGPLVGGIIKALMDSFVSPVSEMIYPTTSNPADRRIKGKELLSNIIKYAIMILIFTLVWVGIYNGIVALRKNVRVGGM